MFPRCYNFPQRIAPAANELDRKQLHSALNSPIADPANPKSIIEQIGSRTLTDRLLSLITFLKCTFLSITIGLMSRSVPDLWGVLVVHCARAVYTNLDDVPCPASRKGFCDNRVINEVSRGMGGCVGGGAD